VVGTLGGGVLLVAGVGLGAGVPADALAERSSGSGGFASVIELVVPWVRSVGADGETWVGAPPAGVVVHEVFVRPGDDASCLQLGQAQTPHVYGVPSAAWGARGTFTVASGAGWEALAARTASGRVPALGDTQTLTWGLRLGVGDVLTLSDDDGAPLELEIVGVVASSFLQGGLIIDAALWREAWPSEAGARMWAVEGPREAVDAWVPGVLDRLQDHGATAESASARMERFLVVEHTYLAVFRALGGLGLALAGLGAAVVLARAAVERSDELSLLRALGFSRARIVGGLVMEHGALVLLGVTAGLAAAVVAAWPALSAPDAHPEWGAVWTAVAACAVGGLAALGVVATWLVRGDPGR
jgi:hypothetical protein